MKFRRLLPALLLATIMLAGCDVLGIESPAAGAARKEAEGKAVGSACRHAGRAIEDCFALNKKADKSAVFAGWKEMNDYMRENKIEEVAPQVKAEAKPSKADAEAADGGSSDGADAKPDTKAHAKH